MKTEDGGWTLLTHHMEDAYWVARPFFYLDYPQWALNSNYDQYLFVDQGKSFSDWVFSAHNWNNSGYNWYMEMLQFEGNVFSGISDPLTWARDQVRVNHLGLFMSWFELPKANFHSIQSTDICHVDGINKPNTYCHHKFWIDAKDFPSKKLMGFANRESYVGQYITDNRFVYDWKIYARKAV